MDHRQGDVPERVYILGAGERAKSIVTLLGSRKDAGMEVVGWDGIVPDRAERKEAIHAALERFSGPKPQVDRVIVALEDRRGEFPVAELLKLRFQTVSSSKKAAALLERLTGKLHLDGLHPSSFIYSEGFRVKPSQQIARRIVVDADGGNRPASVPAFFPIRSPDGSPLFSGGRSSSVRRVSALGGKNFTRLQIRTMRTDAEVAGAKWATKNDPRVTRVGMFMRKTRLDEVPQLWNVLCGDMGFVGPRPERPEFVPWLTEQIPYFNLRT